jgi:hypothetical protein
MLGEIKAHDEAKLKAKTYEKFILNNMSLAFEIPVDVLKDYLSTQLSKKDFLSEFVYDFSTQSNRLNNP